MHVNGSCNLKHTDGGKSNTNLTIGHIGDINLAKVKKCLFTPIIFLNAHDQVLFNLSRIHTLISLTITQYSKLFLALSREIIMAGEYK